MVIRGNMISIEDSIQRVSKKRRSILDRRFNTKVKRDEQIFGGAAVRIESNTYLWDNLPSVADELLEHIEFRKY